MSDPWKELSEKWRVIPCPEPVIDMCLYNGLLVVATAKGVYWYANGKMVPIEFVEAIPEKETLPSVAEVCGDLIDLGGLGRHQPTCETVKEFNINGNGPGKIFRCTCGRVSKS